MSESSIANSHWIGRINANKCDFKITYTQKYHRKIIIGLCVEKCQRLFLLIQSPQLYCWRRCRRRRRRLLLLHFLHCVCVCSVWSLGLARRRNDSWNARIIISFKKLNRHAHHLSLNDMSYYNNNRGSSDTRAAQHPYGQIALQHTVVDILYISDYYLTGLTKSKLR